MTIGRQSDSIWATAAMGEGRQDRAVSETHQKAVAGSRDYGHALGVKHAGEAWRTENRDSRGRFAATPEHDAERHHAEGKQPRGEQRDSFVESYHTGFRNHLSEKEREKRHSSFTHQAIEMNPYTRELEYNTGLDDIDRKYLPESEKRRRFEHYINNGTYEGWKPKSVLDPRSEEGDYQPNPGVSITDRNPAAAELAEMKTYASNVHGIPLTDKHPFSSHGYSVALGRDPGRKSKARGKLPKGSIASDPIKSTDVNGVDHTFWHQISTEFPVDNPDPDPQAPRVIYQTEYPGSKMSEHGTPRLTVALHHIRSDTGVQRPLTSNHTLHSGDSSKSRIADLRGMFKTNDQTRTLYDLGFQRTGDWNDQIKFNIKHPSGKGEFDLERVNGDETRYPNGKIYFDPELGSKKLLNQPHPDYIGEKWMLTPKTWERRDPHDPRSEISRVAHKPIFFKADDDHGFDEMLNHVLHKDALDNVVQPYGGYEQNLRPNNNGLPPERFDPKTGSVRAWSPEFNIHRSAERLPTTF